MTCWACQKLPQQKKSKRRKFIRREIKVGVTHYNTGIGRRLLNGTLTRTWTIKKRRTKNLKKYQKRIRCCQIVSENVTVNKHY